MSKKIIIIGPAYPLRGGLASYNELLASKLQESGHEVKIVTFSLQYPRLLFPGETQYSEAVQPAGLTIEARINSVNPLNWYQVGSSIQEEKPDLVILRYWMPFMAPCLGTISRIIRKNKYTKVIAITDNIIPHESRMGDQLLTRYFLNSCDGFVTMSKAVLEDLASLNNSKPALFNPHPMYENFGKATDKASAKQQLGLESNQDYVLFFGFIRKYKGLDILLQAFADERIQALGLKLIIAGEYYENPAPYQALIQQLNLKHAIVPVNHYIPDHEVAHYFNAADLVAQTYRSATQSGVTQIAYYYETPMLVTDVGGLAELVPHQKVGYVTSQSPQEIADSILDFYTQKREKSFVKNIQQERKKFTWESMIKTLFRAASLD